MAFFFYVNANPFISTTLPLPSPKCLLDSQLAGKPCDSNERDKESLVLLRDPLQKAAYPRGTHLASQIILLFDLQQYPNDPNATIRTAPA